MIVNVNLGAISANAARVKSIAEAANWRICGVIKEGIAKAPIVRAFVDGGISNLAASSARTMRSASFSESQRKRLTLIGLALPSEASQIVAGCSGSAHSCTESVRAFADQSRALRKSHEVFIALRTREDREGLLADDSSAIEAIAAAARGGRTRIAGVMAHFGCKIEAPPDENDIAPILEVARRIHLLTDRPQVVSLGGSILLPSLPLLRSDQAGSLRVAEAIFAGTIPRVARGTYIQPFTLEVDVVEVSRHSASDRKWRVLVNCGSTMIEPGDVTFEGQDASIAFASSEYACVDLNSADRIRVGDTVKLTLGWRSTLRALVNPRIRVRWLKGS